MFDPKTWAAENPLGSADVDFAVDVEILATAALTSGGDDRLAEVARRVLDSLGGGYPTGATS